MIQVRFDEQSRSRLVLIWDGADREPVSEVDASAANLLFSILGNGNGNGSSNVKKLASELPAAPARPKTATPRRRKPRAARAKPH